MKKSLRRIFSLVLSIALLIQPLGVTVFAQETGEPPTITVDSGTPPEQPTATIAAFAPLPPDVAVMQIPVGAQLSDIEFPQVLLATTTEDESIRIEGVTWDCKDFRQDCAVGDSFTVTAVLPDNYALAEGVLPPTILLEMVESGISPMSLNDRIIVDGIIYKEINPTQAQLIGVTESFAGGSVVVPATVPSNGKDFTVVSIEAYAFQNATGLQSITTGDNVGYIGVEAFSGCKALSSVTIAPAVTEIRDKAFQNCTALTGITIPDTVTTIGSFVFDGSGLASIVIPKGLTTIGTNAFHSPKLTSVGFAEGITEVKSSYISGSKTLTTVNFPASVTSIGDSAFSWCTALTEITIPDTVTRIGKYAFQTCRNLSDVTLPDGLESIGDHAFSGCLVLTDITLPDGLASIASYLFYGCSSLTSIEIPSDVTTIGSYAFSGCKLLQTVTLPDGLKSIDWNAFSSCAALREINFPEGLKSIGGYAFQYCSALTSVTIPNSVTSLGFYAFQDCRNLETVTLSNQIESIMQYTFSGCKSLASITIPASVKSIDSWAFENCSSLTSVTLVDGVKSIGMGAFSNCGFTAIQLPNSITSIGQAAFSGCSKLQTINIPNEMTTLGNTSFSGITNLTQITIPASVTTLETNVFSGCTNLSAIMVEGTLTSVAKDAFGMDNNAIITVPNLATAVLVRDSGVKPENIKLAGGGDHGLVPSVFEVDGCTYTVTQKGEVGIRQMSGGAAQFTIPATVQNSGITYRVTSIMESAFSGNTTLTAVTIPDSIGSIGASAFQNCSNLASVTIPNSVTTINASTFYSCTNLTSVSIPDSVTALGDYVFSGCSALVTIVIPDSVKSFGQSLFSGCQSLEFVTLPKNASSLSYAMFNGCSSLVSIAIPDSVMSIGVHAFMSCSSLTEVKIPSGVDYISDYLFYGCTKLAKVNIPEGVTTIGNLAFQDCRALAAITIPNSVKNMYTSAFRNCTSLTEVTIPGDISHLSTGVFAGCTALKKATALSGISASTYSNIFSGCTALEEITISGSCTGVPANMFQNFANLKTITLGEKVQEIGAYAFAGIPITTVSIPNNVATIGERAFDSCAKLGYANIGNGIKSIGLRAFPSSTQLISNDPRVQLLLVEYLSQNEDKRPATTWDGKSNIGAGAVAAVDKEISVTGDVSIAEGAELTIWKPVTISGSFAIEGTVKIGEGGAIIITGGGKVTGSGAAGLVLQYTITMPTAANGNITADKPYSAPGGKITLTVRPDVDYRLKSGTLQYNGTPVPQTDGVYAFTMPAGVVNLSALFESAYISGVSIAAGGDTTLASGKTVTLAATVVPDDTEIATITYAWTASVPGAVTLSGANSANVTVTAKVVRADTPVTLTVTATQGRVTRTASVELLVLRESVQSIDVSPRALRLNPGVQEKLTITALPAGTGSVFTWNSSNPKVAAVDSRGVVHTMELGETTIYAQADGVKSNEITVVVVNEITYATGVELSAYDLAVSVGDTAQITATVAPQTATVRGVWKSSRPSVATVDAIGQVTAVGSGETTLTYTIQKSAKEQIIRIVDVAVATVGITEVTINESPAQKFRKGETLRLTATVKPEQAVDKSLVWSSSNPAVATVTPQGLVTFHGGGNVAITAASVANPTKTSTVNLVAVVDASGVLQLPGGDKAAYKKVEITKDGGAPVAAFTDSAGAFRFTALEAGGYTITSNPNTAGYRLLSKRTEVAQGGGNLTWALEYARAEAGSVEVTLRDTANQPVAGVCVSVQSEVPYQYKVGYSDGAGKVLLDGLLYEETGTLFTVNYSTNDGAFGTKTATLQKGGTAQKIAVELPAISTIRGRVEDERGVGIPGVYVQVGGRGAYTGNDGSYAIRGQLDTGEYTVTLGSWEKYIAKQEPKITVSAGSSVTAPKIIVTNGVSVSGRFLLDGRTDNYQKAYITLYNAQGGFVAGSYASGDGGFVFESAIKQTGNYELRVADVYAPDGSGFLNYTAALGSFTVSSMDTQKIVLEVAAQTKLKTSEIFSGDNNILAADTALVQSGGKFELHAKYRNNGSQTVTATFQTTLAGAAVDPSYAGSEFGQTTHIVTLKPGESGRFYIKALADKTALTVSAATTVTVNGSTHDFARLSIEVANISLSVQSTNIGVGESFSVFGEAATNSKVLIYEQGGGLLGSVQLSESSGRWYSIQLKGFEKQGAHTIFAMAEKGDELAASAPLTLNISSAPVKIERVTVDSLSYEDIPQNSRTGVRTFSHMVDNSLRPDPLDIRTTFLNDAQIAAVTYHLAGQSFVGARDSAGRWYAGISGWRGTGIQPLTATVTLTDKTATQLVIAEVVVLIDPSGYITDKDTGNPLPGAAASCYVKMPDGSYNLWDSQHYAQPGNPSLTDNRGHYGWMVPEGVYKIDVAKAGYESASSGAIAKYSDGIHVPPPALDVNFAMIPATPMSLTGVEIVNGGIEARFSRHVRAADVTVQDSEGREVAVSTEIRGDTVVIAGSFASGEHTVTLRNVLPKSGTAPEYGLASATAKVLFEEGGAGQPSYPSADSDSDSVPFSFLPDWLRPLELSLERIKAAPRSGWYAVVNMTGTDHKISGKDFAAALSGLKPGEGLILRQNGKNSRTEYQFGMKPTTLTTLPARLNFGVTLNSQREKALFEQFFSNNLRVITLEQVGGFGFTADLAVDLDLTGMNEKTLLAYSYNPKTSQYTLLPAAKPYVDSKKFTHLGITAGGIIVLTDAPLKRK